MFTVAEGGVLGAVIVEAHPAARRAANAKSKRRIAGRTLETVVDVMLLGFPRIVTFCEVALRSCGRSGTAQLRISPVSSHPRYYTFVLLANLPPRRRPAE